MKKLVVIIVMSLISFWACDREAIPEESTDVVEESFINQEDAETKKYWGQRCYYFIEYGTKVGRRCYSFPPGICQYRVICIPDIIWDPCQLVPCWIDFLDPWIIYEKIRPEEFLSFKDKLDLNIDIEQGAVPFALNEAILGLQFYAENDMMSLKDKGVITLEQDLVLDAETSESLKLQGNVIKAGEYPVIVNEENRTFNAILAVEKGYKK